VNAGSPRQVRDAYLFWPYRLTLTPSFWPIGPPRLTYTAQPIDPCKKKGDGPEAQGSQLWGAWLAPRNGPEKGSSVTSRS
jgi:hypothetical protein